MTDEGKPARRPRRKGTAAVQELKELLSRRAELDKDKADKERREKDALELYADAAVKLKTIDDAAQQRVEELEKQIRAVGVKAEQDKTGAEAEQARALVSLTELGRTADELSILFKLPVKRVRRMVQLGRKEATADAQQDRPIPRPVPAEVSEPSGSRLPVSGAGG